MSNVEFLSVNLSGTQKWRVAKAVIDFDGGLFLRALEQAEKKSKFTMDASQAGDKRSPEMKFQRQLMGCLAEIYSQEYLKESLVSLRLDQEWQVIRYDDVRDDGFKSPQGEYDLKLTNNSDQELFVESRSSITRDRALADGIRLFDIIGPYVSKAKGHEKYNDIYLRPLYEYVDFAKRDYSDLNFEKLITKGLINLYIVGGCLKQDMISNGYNKDMSQNGTTYKCVKILRGFDSTDFAARLSQILNS